MFWLEMENAAKSAQGRHRYVSRTLFMQVKVMVFLRRNPPIGRRPLPSQPEVKGSLKEPFSTMGQKLCSATPTQVAQAILKTSLCSWLEGRQSFALNVQPVTSHLQPKGKKRSDYHPDLHSRKDHHFLDLKSPFGEPFGETGELRHTPLATKGPGNTWSTLWAISKDWTNMGSQMEKRRTWTCSPVA